MVEQENRQPIDDVLFDQPSQSEMFDEPLGDTHGGGA